MNERLVIIDAGPSLNFCATSTERLMLDVLRSAGTVLAPDVVSREVLNRSRDTRRFGPARQKWQGLVSNGHIQTLVSDPNDERLVAAVDRVAGIPIEARLKRSKDLGEVMVVAQAIVHRDAGDHVVVLIDDGYGQDLAALEELEVISTERILVRAARRGLIANRADMRKLYERMRRCDDGLVSFEQTTLLDHDTWREPA